MLDNVAHQAAGLAALGVNHGPRIAALVSHGDRQSELPLMWQLCTAWTALDYPVVVLDATIEENKNRPGLQQLMADRDEFGRLCDSRENWLVVPAARGLMELRRLRDGSPAETGSLRANQLSTLFASHEVILLYISADDLAQTLPACGLLPLLSVSTQEPALLTAYHALKQLLSNGKLRPTIVSVMDDQTPAARVSGHGVSRNLQECARDFLACEVPALTVCPTLPDDINRLALRTLDNALQPRYWNTTQAPMLAATAPRNL